MKEPTLLAYYPVLEQKHKALIMRALNDQRQEGQGEIHFGILPFVSMSRVASAVKNTTDKNMTNHIWADLCTKLEIRKWLGDPEVKTAYLSLNPYKVHKHFGKRPDLGVKIPVIPAERTRGPLWWNIGAREWQPQKIIAAPRVTLTLQKETIDLYQLAAPRRYFDLAHMWLVDNCE